MGLSAEKTTANPNETDISCADIKDMVYPVKQGSLKELKEFGGIKKVLAEDHDKHVIDLAGYISGKNECKKLYLRYKPNGEISASCYVGAAWLDENESIPIIINPKFKYVDYLTMLTQVLSENSSLTKLLEFELNQSLIGIDDSKKELLFIQLLVYLKRLNEFCRRDLKKSFIREEENLVGKVKGKILIKNNITKNSIRGRADRVFCQYQTFSIDNLDNQILKRALWVTKNKLNEINVDEIIKTDLWNWVRQCEAAMDQVSLVEIFPRDLVNKTYSGFNRRYKDIYKLAKMILMNFRIDSEGKCESRDATQIIPFSINMNTLFEKYVGVYLKKIGLTEIEAPTKKTEAFDVVNSSEINIFIKPDYLGKKIVNVNGENSSYGVIIDAKYKELFEEIIQENGQDDSIDLPLKSPSLTAEVFDWIKKIPNSEIYQLISYLIFYRGKKSDFFEDVKKTSIKYGVLVFPSDSFNGQTIKWDDLIKATPGHYPMRRIPIVVNGEKAKNDEIIIIILPCSLPVKAKSPI